VILDRSQWGTIHVKGWLSNLPRIPDNFNDSVFYLYKTHKEAECGCPRGGTGFLVGIGDEASPSFLYAITNTHLIAQDYFFLRINSKGGEPIKKSFGVNMPTPIRIQYEHAFFYHTMNSRLNNQAYNSDPIKNVNHSNTNPQNLDTYEV